MNLSERLKIGLLSFIVRCTRDRETALPVYHSFERPAPATYYLNVHADDADSEKLLALVEETDSVIKKTFTLGEGSSIVEGVLEIIKSSAPDFICTLKELNSRSEDPGRLLLLLKYMLVDAHAARAKYFKIPHALYEEYGELFPALDLEFFEIQSASGDIDRSVNVSQDVGFFKYFTCQFFIDCYIYEFTPQASAFRGLVTT